MVGGRQTSRRTSRTKRWSQSITNVALAAKPVRQGGQERRTLDRAPSESAALRIASIWGVADGDRAGQIIALRRSSDPVRHGNFLPKGLLRPGYRGRVPGGPGAIISRGGHGIIVDPGSSWRAAKGVHRMDMLFVVRTHDTRQHDKHRRSALEDVARRACGSCRSTDAERPVARAVAQAGPPWVERLKKSLNGGRLKNADIAPT
jgi:hypothetical protein